MNRFNMSDDALTLKSNSKRDIQNAITDIHDAKLKNYKLIFLENKHESIGYVYSDHSINDLPMISGDSFTNKVFNSQIDFAIQGSSSKLEDYKPQSQNYIEHNGNYVSVIGKMNFPSANILNQQTLISLSPRQSNAGILLKNVEIAIDGKIVNSKRGYHKLKRILKVSDTQKYRRHNISSFDRRQLVMFRAVLAFIVVLIGGIEYLALTPIKHNLKNAKLTGDLRNNYRNGLLLKYYLYTLIPYGISYFLINWRFMIVRHYIVNSVMVFSILFMIVMGLVRLNLSEDSY